MSAVPLTGFFGRTGYALVALSALHWAAEGMQSADAGERAAATAWVTGDSSAEEPALSFELCVQAIGMASRREELRSVYLEQPSEALARVLLMERLVEGGDEGEPGDETLKSERHDREIFRLLHGANVDAPQPRPYAVEKPW